MTTITLEEIADGLRSQLKMACQAARQEAAVADKALRDLAAAQERAQAAEAQVERLLLDSEAAHACITALRDDRTRLQQALYFWLPSIAGEETPAGERAAKDSYLLISPDLKDEPSAYELGWTVMDSEAKLLREEAQAAEARAEKAEGELASVRAHAEASGDEVVRELQRVVLPSLRDYGQGYSAAVAERAASHIIALRAELASVSGHAEAMAVTLDSWARLDGGCKCAALDAYRAAHPKDAP